MRAEHASLCRRKATAAANAAREAARDEQNQAELQEGAPSLFAFMNTRLSEAAYSGDGRSAPLQTILGSNRSTLWLARENCSAAVKGWCVLDALWGTLAAEGQRP